MRFAELKVSEGIATVIIGRGKVNSLNGMVVRELTKQFKELEDRTDVKAVVLTGRSKSFKG